MLTIRQVVAICYRERILRKGKPELEKPEPKPESHGGWWLERLRRFRGDPALEGLEVKVKAEWHRL